MANKRKFRIYRRILFEMVVFAFSAIVLGCNHFSATNPSVKDNSIFINKVDYKPIRGTGLHEILISFQYNLSQKENAYALVGLDVETPGYPILQSVLPLTKGYGEKKVVIQAELPERPFFAVYLFLSESIKIDMDKIISRDAFSVRRGAVFNSQRKPSLKEEEEGYFEELSEREKEEEIIRRTDALMESGRFPDRDAARKAAESDLHQDEFIRWVKSKK